VCRIQLSSWYTQVGEAVIKQCTDMGVNLTTAQDYIDTHQTLMTDLKVSSLLSSLSYRGGVYMFLQLLTYLDPSPIAFSLSTAYGFASLLTFWTLSRKLVTGSRLSKAAIMP